MFKGLETSYAYALLLMNLEKAVTKARSSPDFSNLQLLAWYYWWNTADSYWVHAEFKNMEIDSIFVEGLRNESLLKEDYLHFSADGVTAFLFTLARLLGAQKSLEFYKRMFQETDRLWADDRAKVFDSLPKFVGGEETQDFLDKIVRDEDLGFRSEAIHSIAINYPDLVDKYAQDEELDVESRFQFIEEMRRQETPVPDPDYIEEFYTDVKNDQELPKETRQEAAVYLGDFKAVWIMPSLTALAVALGCSGAAVLAMFLAFELSVPEHLMGGLTLAFWVFAPVLVLGLPYAVYQKLKKVKWYRKRHTKSDI
jgi:hypothetical protein